MTGGKGNVYAQIASIFKLRAVELYELFAVSSSLLSSPLLASSARNHFQFNIDAFRGIGRCFSPQQRNIPLSSLPFFKRRRVRRVAKLRVTSSDVTR